MNVIKEIKTFAKDRLINELEPNMLDYATNVVEEVVEGIGGSYNKDTRSGLKDRLNDFLVNELKIQEQSLNKQVDKHAVIDALCDITVFSITEMMKHNYDPEAALIETAKEINSRRGEIVDQKFQKYTDDYHKSLWYKADYDKTKITEENEYYNKRA